MAAPHGDYYDPSNKVVYNGDTAKAEDLNAINTAVDTALDTVADDLDTLENNTSNWSENAEKWAKDDVGTNPDPLQPNEYSSKANASESKNWASSATSVIDSAGVDTGEKSAKTLAAEASADADDADTAKIAAEAAAAIAVGAHTISAGDGIIVTPVGVDFEVARDSGDPTVSAGTNITITPTGTGTPADPYDYEIESIDTTVSSDGFIAGLIPTNWREVIRTGWTPAWFNQQWGGAPYGDAYQEVATGLVYEGSRATATGVTAPGSVKKATSFLVSRDMSIGGIVVNLSKNELPTTDITITIEADNAGDPSGTPLATSTGIPCRVLGEELQEVEFTFPTPLAVTANTKYHWVIQKVGTHATYTVNVAESLSEKYPNGTTKWYDGTSWNTQVTYTDSFKLIPTTSTADGKLNCYEGTPLNQSGAATRSIRECVVGDTICYNFRAENITNNKPLLDMVYGLEQDRIYLRVYNNYLHLAVFGSSGIAASFVGTTLITSGEHTIGIVVEDGNHEIWVDGVLDASSGAAVTFSEDFKNKGTVIIGGGMPYNVTWTKETDMSVLPSADGWTWNGTATEANAMSVVDGKLYQNKNGYGSTEYGSYSIDGTSFNNTNGWVAEIGLESHAGDDRSCIVQITDGTYGLIIQVSEDFLSIFDGALYNPLVQLDMGTLNSLSVFGKGDDFYIFVNGKLVVDGTGKLSGWVTTTNKIVFGDNYTAAGGNADAVYDYINYKEGWEQPEYTTASISDLGFWSKDISEDFLKIHSNGLEQAIGLKSLPTVERVATVKGIEVDYNNTANLMVEVEGMRQFFLGESALINYQDAVHYPAASVLIRTQISVDGNTASFQYIFDSTAGGRTPLSLHSDLETDYGLHFTNASNQSDGTNQVYSSHIFRHLTVRSK